MSPTNPAGADSATRQKILRATLDWVAERGLVQLSMNGVAKRARIARATLYLHFPGKQALIDAAMDQQVTELMSAASDYVRAYDDRDERAVRGFAHTYRLLKSNPVLQAVLHLDPAVLMPHLLGKTPTLDRARDFITGLIRPGDLPAHLNAPAVGDYLVRLLLTLVLSPPTTFDAERPGAVEDWARCFVLPVLHAAPPADLAAAPRRRG